MCIKYPQNVVITDIEPKNPKSYRTFLEITFKKCDKSLEGKIIAVIMMNPSAANRTCSDVTVNKIIKALKGKTNKIYIFNLFPFYEPDSEELYKKLSDSKANKILTENETIIQEKIKDTMQIILAWGDIPPNITENTHNEHVKNLIKITEFHKKNNNLYVFDYKEKPNRWILSSNKRPLHPSRKSIHDIELIKSYKFDSNDFLLLNFGKT